MPVFEDEPPRKIVAHEIGQDLSRLSIAELEERVALLKAEIVRLEEAGERKRASATAADAFFKPQR